MRVADDVAKHAIAAEHDQAAAQLRLKDYHQAEQHGGEQVIEHVAELGQIEAGQDHLGNEKEADDDKAQAAHHA